LLPEKRGRLLCQAETIIKIGKNLSKHMEIYVMSPEEVKDWLKRENIAFEGASPREVVLMEFLRNFLE
jgi:hypothetical protein